MARITVEDCLDHESNRFSLVRLATIRAKQLLSGAPGVADSRGNKEVVAALREIAAGKIKFSSAANVKSQKQSPSKAEALNNDNSSLV